MFKFRLRSISTQPVRPVKEKMFQGTLNERERRAHADRCCRKAWIGKSFDVNDAQARTTPQESLSYSRRLPARALKKKHSLKLKLEVRKKKKTASN